MPRSDVRPAPFLIAARSAVPRPPLSPPPDSPDRLLVLPDVSLDLELASPSIEALYRMPALTMLEALRTSLADPVSDLLTRPAAIMRDSLDGASGLQAIRRGVVLAQAATALPTMAEAIAAQMPSRVAVARVLEEAHDRIAAIAAPFTMMAQTVFAAPWLPWLQRERTVYDWAAEIADRERSPEERLAIAEELAPFIGYWPRDARALSILRARQEAEGRSAQAILRDETLAAIYIVADLARQTVTLRVTKHLSAEYAGCLVSAVPYDDLPVVDYWHWFRSRVRATINQSLLELPSNKARWEPDHSPEVPFSDHFIEADPDELLMSPEPDPLTALLEREHASEIRRALALVAEATTDRQRQLLWLLSQGLTTPDAARQLDIHPTTARVMLKQIRDRVRPA